MNTSSGLFKRDSILEKWSVSTCWTMNSWRCLLKESNLSSSKKTNTCSDRETKVRSFICLYKVKQRHKEQFSYSKKILIPCIEDYRKFKQEEDQRNLLSFHMQILKEFTTILRRKKEWSWEYWLQLRYLAKSKSQLDCRERLMYR